MSGQMCTLNPAFPAALEIHLRHQAGVIFGRLAAIVRHREEGRLVPLLTHQPHQFEQIYFGTAERELKFVAVQDFHWALTPRKGRPWPETGWQKFPDSFGG